MMLFLMPFLFFIVNRIKMSVTKYLFHFKSLGTSLGVHWLKLCAFTAGGMSSLVGTAKKKERKKIQDE